MNEIDLEKFLKRHCATIFHGIYPIDRLPRSLPTRRPLLLVANTDPHDKPGRHWIAIYLDTNNGGEYFDSMGEEPLRLFDKFLSKFCSRYVYNDLQIQSRTSFVCGHHVLVYSLLKELKMSLHAIILLFSNDFHLNDVVVHRLYHTLMEKQ